MENDNESFYCEREFYSPEEYGKEKKMRNYEIVTQYDKRIRTWAKFRNPLENDDLQNITKNIYDLNVWNLYCFTGKKDRKLEKIPTSELMFSIYVSFLWRLRDLNPNFFRKPFQ